jgi:thiamine biosynthesis lipoprotein
MMWGIGKHILFWISAMVFLFYPKKDLQEFNIHGYAQGTDYSIKYFAADSLVAKSSIDSILALIDASMSLYKPNTLINRFNASGLGFRLDPHMLKVVKKSFDIYEDTQGKFDVTVAPLVQAWGFGAKRIKEFPDYTTIQAILPCVGMDKIHLKGDFLYKDKACIQVDLNGIAQGYSVDVVADYMIGKGIRAFVVEIGGELRIKGPKPDGTAMRIGIEGPAVGAGDEPVIRHVIQLNEGAVTTSGNYRKFVERGKKKVSHLINPKTGYPLNNALISVTIYAKDALTADGYDNALMAMDVEEALRFVHERKGMEAYLVYHRKDGMLADTMSRGFRKMIITDVKNNHHE